jgi:hypothetical protein
MMINYSGTYYQIDDCVATYRLQLSIWGSTVNTKFHEVTHLLEVCADLLQVLNL